MLPERQVNSAYFTYLIVIQVSVWQHRHFHPSASFATTTASAGAAALFCSPAPTALLQVPPLPPSLLCLLGCRAVLPHPVPPGSAACWPRSCVFLHLPLQRSQRLGVLGRRHPAALGDGEARHSRGGRLSCSPWLGDRGAAALAGVGVLCPQPSPLAWPGMGEHSA